MVNANVNSEADVIDIQPKRGSNVDNLFYYEYDNILHKGNYSQRYQTKNRKITSNKVDTQLPDNSIKTAKYTLANFVPKQLFFQFSKLSNLYFLAIGMMQMIPQLSISNQIPVIFLPLSLIIFLSAMKDLYEDWKRRIQDKEENNAPIKVLQLTQINIFNYQRIQQDGDFSVLTWKELRVGHIIKVEQDQTIPADILLLSSSEAKGLGYIETKCLDGETNLKIKNVPNHLLRMYTTVSQLFQNKIILKYEAPNHYLNRFYGEIIDSNDNNVAVNFNSFLLRGQILRNVKYIYGLVVFTGHDSKIMLNSFKGRIKKSKLEITMQRQIVFIFIIQMTVCSFCAIYYLTWYRNNDHELEYLGINLKGVEDNSTEYNFFVRTCNWILIFTNFVPISLLVTLEMVKFTQGLFIIQDQKMSQTTVQSSCLNEELGQIEYIFSDKTGTLTCNIMEFKQITIGVQQYGQIDKEDSNYITDLSTFPKVSNVDFRDNRILEELKNPLSPNHQAVEDCLYHLAICHTIITDIKNGDMIYNASSPDELALVNFARFCGFEYSGTEDNIISVRRGDQVKKFQLIEVFEFTSLRKRQSVLIRTIENDQVWLYTKGADSVLLDPLFFSEEEMEQRQKHSILNQHLQKYGEVGLRTLVLCRRQVETEEFMEWHSRYLNATMQLEGREEGMWALQEELEKGFEVIAATAIEDKLQANVGETIAAIKQAGIKVWVLTGDKIETAVNIGHSCKLLTSSMKQHLVDEKEESMIRKCLNDIILELQIKPDKNKKGYIQVNQNTGFQIENNRSSQRQSEIQHALIISGEALFHALKPGISSMVMQIAEQCSAVLCCRVSPSQKQDVVSLVRKQKPNVSTLAIGDGANDVNMITAAHVGVGIRGKEGQQAARASDYAIGEFQSLRRLLFYHGRESYRRNSRLVCYNFFKNALLVMPQFWYGTLSVFSAQSLYDSFLYQLYNILYASMPIIIYAVFDEEYRPQILVNNQPNYYAQGLNDTLFNSKIFFLWVLNGVWQAAIICYFASYINFCSFVSIDGYTSHVWANGTMLFGLVVLVCNFKILIFSNTHTIISTIGIVGSLISYLISWVTIDTFSSAEAYQVFRQLWSTGTFHLGNILIIGATSMIDLAIELYSRWSQPMIYTDVSKSNEAVKSPNLQSSLRGMTNYTRGRLNKVQNTHTGFAFCSLERPNENKSLKYKLDH